MRRLVLCMATLIAIPTFAQTSAHVFGLKAGLNLSRFNHDNHADSDIKPGVNFGLYVKTPVARNIYLRPEIFYSNQGEKKEMPLLAPGLRAEHSIHLNYLNVPLLFEAGKKVTIQAGPQVSYLLTAYDRTTSDDETIKNSIRSSMRDFDLSAVIGIGINPHESFNAGMRLNYGVVDVYKTDDSSRNHVFHVYLGYTF